MKNKIISYIKFSSHILLLLQGVNFNMTTIKEIAEKAGVSISTVSRVLNYDPALSISNDTRQRVFETAEQLSYRKKKKVKTNKAKIALVYWYTEKEELEDLYFSSIRIGIENRCEFHKMQIVKFFQGIEKGMIDEQIQGIIALGKFSEEQIKSMQIITKNIVFVDSSPNEDTFDSVVTDYRLATKKVIDHFVSYGHQKIGYIGSRKNYKEQIAEIINSYENTIRSYLSQKNLYLRGSTYYSSSSADEGYFLMKNAIEELGERLPTAFLVGNDIMAIGCLRALHEAKISVPEKVSIIGMNDLSISKYVYPSLSTVKVYSKLMGETSVDLLMERIVDRKIAKKVVFSTELIIRKSSY